MKELKIPLAEEEIRKLRIGDVVYLTGIIYTARDMAHLRINNLLSQKKDLPVEFKGSAIFHAGPVAKKVGDNWKLEVIGPTTSIRMEPYAEMIGVLGVRAIIGKGGMEKNTSEACKKYGYVYLQAAPGCAVTLAKGVEKINTVVWEDLAMPEAVWVLETNQIGPFVVGMDTMGNSIYRDLKDNAVLMLENRSRDEL